MSSKADAFNARNATCCEDSEEAERLPGAGLTRVVGAEVQAERAHLTEPCEAALPILMAWGAALL